MALENYSRTLFVNDSLTYVGDLTQAQRMLDFAAANGYDKLALLDTDLYFVDDTLFESFNSFLILATSSGITNITAVTVGDVDPLIYSNYINKYGNLHGLIFYSAFWDTGNFTVWKTNYSKCVDAMYIYGKTATYPSTESTQPMFWLKDVITDTTVRDGDAVKEIFDSITNSGGVTANSQYNVYLDLLDVTGIPSIENANSIKTANVIGRLDSIAEAAQASGVTANVYLLINAGVNYSGANIAADYDSFEQSVIKKLKKRMSKFQTQYITIKGFGYSNYTSANSSNELYRVFSLPPNIPNCATVTSPAAGATNVSRTPTFQWNQSQVISGYGTLCDVSLSYNNTTFWGVANNVNLVSPYVTSVYQYTIGGSQTLLPGTVHYLKIVPKFKSLANGSEIANTGCSTVRFKTTGTIGTPSCATLISPGSSTGTTGVSATTPVTFTWTPPPVLYLGGSSNYYSNQKLRYTTNAGVSWTEISGLAPTTSTYQLSSAFGPSTAVTWSVIPYTGSTSASGCTTFKFTTAVGIPACPSLTGQTPANNATNVVTTPTIYWNAVNGATSYTLEYGTNSTLANPTAIPALSATSYTLPALSNNTQYYYRVKAVNSAGSSSGCNIYNFTTIPAVPGCPTYQNPTPANGLTPLQPTSSYISWSAIVSSTGPADYYEVWVGQNTTTLSRVAIQGVGGTALTYRWPAAGTVPNLNWGTTYYYKVLAGNAAGVSSCATRSFATEPQPPPAGGQGYVPEPTRVLKVNDFDQILNQPVKETALLDYAKAIGCNWIQFYSLNAVFDNATLLNALPTFISKSKAGPYYMQRVGAIRSQRRKMQEIFTYNQGKPSHQQIDDFNWENEFWIPSNSSRISTDFEIVSASSGKYSIEVNGLKYDYNNTGTNTSTIATNLYNSIVAGNNGSNILTNSITVSLSSNVIRFRGVYGTKPEGITSHPVTTTRNIFNSGSNTNWTVTSASIYNPEGVYADYFVQGYFNDVVVTGNRSPYTWGVANHDFESTYSTTRISVGDENATNLTFCAYAKWLREAMTIYNSTNNTNWIISAYIQQYSGRGNTSNVWGVPESKNFARNFDVYEATSYGISENAAALNYLKNHSNHMAYGAQQASIAKVNIIPIFSAEGGAAGGDNFFGVSVLPSYNQSYRPNYPAGLSALETSISRSAYLITNVPAASQSFLNYLEGANYFKYSMMTTSYAL